MNTVAKAFCRAASTYDAAAHAQQHAATWLLAALPNRPVPSVADIGCGTGFLLPSLAQRFPAACVVGCDIASAMLHLAKQRYPEARLFQADARQLPLRQIPLLISNLTLQWLPADTLKHWRQCLRSDGHFVVTTLGDGTFAEWRRACTAAAIPCGVPNYPSRTAWLKLYPGVSIDEKRLTLSYPTSAAFLRELKQLGAHTPALGYRPLPPGALRRALRWLDDKGGLHATYHLLRLQGGS